MKQMFKLLIIVSTALLVLFSCKPKPILLPVLDNNDRKLLETIKQQALEGDSLVKLAKELPKNANLPLSYDMRVRYAQAHFEKAKKILNNVQKKRNIADEIFAMKLAMYNKRSYFSKDTIIPQECKPCYEKLNAIEARLEYLELLEEIPTSIKGFESAFKDDCKCIYEK
jgi:hypothetical protein